MTLIAAKDVTEPKILGSPPGWLLVLLNVMPIGLLAAIFNLPIESLLIKYVAGLMICLVGIVFAKNDRTFIYTIPQLRDRDNLIQRFNAL